MAAVVLVVVAVVWGEHTLYNKHAIPLLLLRTITELIEMHLLSLEKSVSVCVFALQCHRS